MVRKLLYRFRKVLYLLILLLAVLGSWWWCQPRPLRLVATIPIDSYDCQFSVAGFLLHKDTPPFTLYDWQDGHIRWQVTPKTVMPGESWLKSANFIINNTNQKNHPLYAISPDGHYLVTASQQQDSACVQIWHDGIQVCNRMMSLPKPSSFYPFMVDVSDAGQVFFCRRIRPALPMTPRRNPIYTLMRERFEVLVLEENRVIAHGLLPPHVLAVSGDGARACTHPETLYTVTIVNGTVCFTPINSSAASVRILTQSFQFSDDSTRFDASHLSPSSWYAQPGGAGQCRILNPASRNSWTFPEPCITSDLRQQRYFVSNDGRYVASWYLRKSAIQQTVDLLSKRWSYLERFSNSSQIQICDIYERPGKLRARLSLPMPSDPPDEMKEEYMLCVLSPDGHSILVQTENLLNGKISYSIYRW